LSYGKRYNLLVYINIMNIHFKDFIIVSLIKGE
jgi:hypothetical protein